MVTVLNSFFGGCFNILSNNFEKCAFYSYSLPTCLVMALSINTLQSRGYLSPSKFFQNPWLSKAPKIIVGVALGYTFGQVIVKTTVGKRLLDISGIQISAS